MAYPPGTVFLPGGRERVERAAREGADAPFDVVCFDMDGTLVDEMSSWEFVHDHFEVSNHENWARYDRGEIDDAEFMRTDIELWGLAERPIALAEVARILERAPVVPNADVVMRELRGRGVALGIVSGGLDVLAQRVAGTLGMDFHIANGLTVDARGMLTGRGVVNVPIRDKGTATRRFLDAAGCARTRSASVGNSKWDVTMFRATDFGVAFYPIDDHVREGADAVVEGNDMRPVLDALLEPRRPRARRA